MLADPDPVDRNGMTPLCVSCQHGNAEVAAALLDGGANINLAINLNSVLPGYTPLMCAAVANLTGVVKLLLERGADGTNTTTARSPPAILSWSATSMMTIPSVAAGSTALDIARTRFDASADCAETLAVLRLMCCSTCGMTSAGMSATTAGENRRLKRCGSCPARGPCAHYCGAECQRADWASRHREECAEVRRARQAAGTEV